MTKESYICQLEQVTVPPPDGIDGRRDAMAKKIRAADDAVDLIVFPELSLTGYHIFDRLDAVAETVPGRTTEHLGTAAKAASVDVVVGMPVADKDGPKNTAVWIGRDGAVQAIHEKRHLWGDERDAFTSGPEYTIVDTDFGRVGLLICYEVNFPEASLALAREGVDVIVVISAWSKRMAADWNTLLPSRALENGAFLVGCNLVGTEAGTTFCGRSMVIGPDGSIVEELDDRPGSLVAKIDRVTLDQEHDRNPMRVDRFNADAPATIYTARVDTEDR